MENDSENWMRYKLGSTKKIMLKKGVVPHLLLEKVEKSPIEEENISKELMKLENDISQVPTAAHKLQGDFETRHLNKEESKLIMVSQQKRFNTRVPSLGH